MTLAANALVSVEDATGFLQAGGTDEAIVEDVVNRASQLVEQYCDRALAERALTNVRLRGPEDPHLYLAAAPIKVTATITVTVNGQARTVWKQESDGDPAAFDVMVARSVESGVLQPDHLYCGNGWCPASQRQPYNVVLAYTGGFALANVPADLRDAVLLTVRRLFDDQKKSVGEVVAVNTPAGGVTLFDRWLPSRAREILDMAYRRVTVG